MAHRADRYSSTYRGRLQHFLQENIKDRIYSVSLSFLQSGAAIIFMSTIVGTYGLLRTKTPAVYREEKLRTIYIVSQYIFNDDAIPHSHYLLHRYIHQGPSIIPGI